MHQIRIKENALTLANLLSSYTIDHLLKRYKENLECEKELNINYKLRKAELKEDRKLLELEMKKRNIYDSQKMRPVREKKESSCIRKM